MTETDNRFFEKYKRLDKLCSEIYDNPKGISSYIADMEENEYIGQKIIGSWRATYKSLKHVRRLRNRIAHDENISDICTSDDIDFVTDFYNQIFSSIDPISQLEKRKTNSYTSDSRNTEVFRDESPFSFDESSFKMELSENNVSASDSNKKKKNVLSAVTLIVLIAVILFFFISKYVSQ
ncbi:MAG TPA: hypothetical protein DIW36_07500 [Ruminococcaceae bacterium]|nr:hypothetical protein [Oscillospiraceae bacterium]